MKVKKFTKKQPPTPPDIACVIDRILKASDQDLLSVLRDFQSWRYPRGDLHAWTGVLDRFDTVLAHIISSYDLTKIQTNDFTPQTRSLVLEILRCINLLLASCTNRKLFNSYDRLYDLLLTSDLGVLLATLFVLLRPAQQYASQTPYERGLGRKLSTRLLVLARGLDSLRSQGIDLKDLVTKDELHVPEETANITITFYPNLRPSSLSPSKSAKPTRHPKAGAETATTLELGNVQETMAVGMPDRLSELAEKHGMAGEDQYETLNKLRWILALKDKATRQQLVSARLLALATYAFLTPDDAAQSSIFLYEPDLISQIAELVSTSNDIIEPVRATALFALDAVAHHRKLSEILTALGANLNHGILMTQFRNIVDRLASGKPVLHELVDGMMTFVAFVATSQGHAHMLTGSGIIPILLEMLLTKSDKRDNYIPRATGLLDAVVFSHAQSLPMFSNLDGVNILVGRVRSEIDEYLESIPTEPTDTLSEDSIIFYQTNPLRAILRSVHRLMQSSGGTEGLRNLVDSDLPKSIKRIFENSKRFGPRLFALAINVMATFVHNEPTSLTILQEQNLPQTLIGVFETEMPASFDVMITIPNAIGAICLNQTGLDYVTSHSNILVNLINVAASETNAEWSERDNAQQIGTSLDELARHHPSLKPIIMEAIMGLLHKSLENGKSFVHPQEELREYSLQALTEATEKSKDTKVPTNEPLDALTRLFKILDGLLRNTSLTKEFIKKDGVQLLMSTADLPCIPLQFGSSSAAVALSNVLRAVGDTDHVQLAEIIVKSIEGVLADTTALWKDENAQENWAALATRVADDAILQQFYRLRGISIRLAYLSEAFMGLAWSHTRVTTSLVKSLGVTGGTSFVSDLAKLHRVCFREHARIAPQVASQQKTPTSLTAEPSTVIGIDDIDAIPTQTGTNLNLAAQLMTTRLHAVLTRTFRTAIKLLFGKRNSDGSHRKEADALAGKLAEEIIQHLTAPSTETAIVDADTVAVGLATLLLFDDRGHEGRLNTILFIKFEKAGGMKTLLAAIDRIISHMDEITKTPVAERSEDQKKDVARTIAGIRISFLVMVALVQPMSLMDNPQTHALQNRSEDSDRWDPLDTFLQLRLDILPYVHRVWAADWLPESPLPIIKHATKGFLTIMEGKNETSDPARIPVIAPAPFVPPVRPRIVADPARVDQLVDMGFPRGSADYALIRTRNNVAAAAEMILTMPHLFQDIVEQPPAPAPEPAQPPPGPTEEAAEPDLPQQLAEEAAPPPVPPAQDEFTEMVGSAMDIISAAFGIEAPVQVGNDEASSGGGPSANAAENDAPAADAAPLQPESGSSMDVDAEPKVPIKEQLDALRSEYKSDVASRALVILDHAQDLVFDLLPAFPKGLEGAHLLLDRTLDTVKGTGEDRDKQLAARLRMVTVYVRETVDVVLNDDALRKVVEIISPLSDVRSPRPEWTPVLLLFAEAAFAGSTSINTVKIGDEPTQPIYIVSKALNPIISSLTAISTTILADDKSTRDETLASLRLLVSLTRRQPELLTAEVTQKVISPFVHPSPNLHGCQPYIAMILRHAFEDHETLTEVMQHEIRQYLVPTRNKVTDVNHFVRQLRQAAAREPTVFIEAIEKECTLIDPSPPQSVYHIRSKDKAKTEQPVADPFQDTDDHRKNIPMIDLLLAELGKAINQSKEPDVNLPPIVGEGENDKGKGKEETQDLPREEGAEAKNTDKSQAYIGLIISVLTEILGSYAPAKKAFMTAIRKHGSIDKSSHKSGLTVLINDVICGVDLSEDIVADDSRSSPESAKRIALSSWTSSLLVALCADTFMTADHKEVSESLTSVRKAVLDAVAKAIKDLSITEPSARYGRLWALGELTYRLLLHKPSIPNQPSDGSSIHIAKIMLEKNFVSLLTAATSEIDLNYPGVRLVLGSLLRALEHLTKISIKWSKGEKAINQKNRPASPSSSRLEESDMDMDISGDEQDDAPDLYRNSALGMLGGEIRDDDSESDEDGDDEDEDMMDAYGDEIMDEMMDDDDQTEPSEEDEGSEGTEEDEWTDEDMEEGTDIDNDGPEVVIGEPLEQDDEDGWDDEVDDHEEDMMSDEEGGAMEIGFDDGMYDEGPEDGDEDDMEEEDYDELDLLDPLPTADQGAGFSAPPEISGHWGWEQSSGNQNRGHESLHRMSRLLDPDGVSASLFGGPPRPAPVTTPAQPPLIAQPSARDISRREPRGSNNLGSLFAALEDMGGPQAVQMMENLLARSGRSLEAIRISFASGDNGQIDLSIGNRSFHVPAQGAQDTQTAESVAAGCVPKPTLHRWDEEMKMSPLEHDREFFAMLTIHIINRLLPETKKRHDEDLEKARVEEEERAKKEAEERQTEAEEAAKIALPESRATPVSAEGPAVAESSSQPQRDVEMLEPAEAAAAESTEAANAVGSTSVAEEMAASGSDSTLVASPERRLGDDGLGSAAADADAPQTETLARTVVMVHGREVDITDTGIDLEFLQALPDDMRADVIEQHMREHRRLQRQTAPPDNAAPALASSISPEFLDALPPEIRAEVIMQEAMENSRRNRAQPAGGEAAPVHTGARTRPDIAHILGVDTSTDFLTALDNDLRDMMLLGPSGGAIGMPVPHHRTRVPGQDQATSSKRSHRESLQLLEKPGIASLVRLLFFPESFEKTHLFHILANLCENATTRSDLLNLLISVIQDGSGDLPLVDRSFQQMSLRAMATPKSTNKAKAAESPAPVSSSSLFAHLQTENIPTFIAQRCLEALAHIVGANYQAVHFFLTEHEQGVGLKKVSTKKGKGKEKLIPQTKFPIVILLGLLERTALLSTAGMMESLTALFNTITRPLNLLKAKQNENNDGKGKKKDEPEVPSSINQPPTEQAVASTATPVDTTATAPVTASAPPNPALDLAHRNGLTKPPTIPAPVMRLVINCLTTGECSSRNFTQSLVLMQNLCCIPDAKEILLQELRDRSQKLGTILLGELQALAASLSEEKFEATSPALAVFSSPSCSQAQLLRLLKAIEYMHVGKVDSDPPGDVLTDGEKEAVESYGSLEFDPMWAQLQRCLTLVEERESTEPISLILLPLVEALMVVCKYRRSPPREARASSGPPLSSIADSSDLFLSFTTVHRKVLNTIVRNNPALLGGSFSLLIRNSRVLEFDNKRQWFFQKLKRKRDHNVPSGALHLAVRRQYVFEDSFRALQPRSGNEIKYGKLGVKFHNEDGIDAGGVSREWYSVLAQQIFDPNFALFEPCAADQQTYQPNKHSFVNGDHLAYFKFIGRIIGKAVYDGRLLDAYFSRAFYKQILGRPVDMRDLESIDPEYHKSLQWMLDNDITGVIDQEFTFEDDQFGEKKVVELKEGGAKIPVTEENKEEYVRLVVSYRLDNSIKDQNKAFLDGFYDIIPRELIQIFEPDQLELLISGITTIDVDELKNATQMSGWKTGDPEVGWFWRALRSFSQEERSRFLMFVTSSSRVPLGGFTQLQGASGIQPFQIQRLYAKEGSLPQASTCFNLLLLPKYASYEQLRERLQFAVTETGGFGKA